MPDQEAPPPERGPGKTPQGRARLPSSRPREKPQLSCNLCRRRKLRCDRQRPCSSCFQRELGPSCTYSSERTSTRDAAHRPRVTTQDQIRHLESLVVDLMQQSSATHSAPQPGATPASPGPTPAHDSSPQAALNELPHATTPPADYGSMQLTGGGASYVSSAHWAAVLDGIAELKDHFDNEEAMHPDHQAGETPCPDATGPQLLYGCPKLATREEILASLPARSVVDRLVSRYFNSFEMSPAVLHSVQFLKEYEEFWENPAATPLIWLGLLFTIICLATQFQKFRLDPGVQAPVTLSMEQDLQKMADTFRLRIAQCLALGNYAKGGPYVLETLMLYIAAEVFLSNDAEMGVWILMGTTVQLAMHMGYHRDPTHFKGMSPFDAEMRRRVWATIVEMDLGISAQMGLPRLIKQWQTDTREPSNLQDNDFDKTTVEMPPSRPQTDLTPILYRLVKARLMTTIGYIWDFAADVRSYSYTEVMKMDMKLEEARKSIPDCLRWHSIARCIMDSPQNIMQKVILETVFYRAKIVLHRKYMFCPPAKYGDSRRICLESALKLLDYQHMLQEETQPFCQLYQERWRVSSLVNHDFLLATSILCFYLHNARGEASQSAESPMDEAILASLRRSYDIWLQSSGSSKEARRAAQALAVILGGGNPSGADSGIDTNTSLGVPSPYPSSSISGYRQDNPTGFGFQFPAFDAALASNWATPTDELLSASVATTNFDWQTMDDTVDTMGSLKWPWNLQ
ncbi:fungal-specific transcription factor domain-containing protein [Thelonectria olida]|uniref:Fungal-specific transcription factor domain-containing protein n=1 Tax=Thelonectria olida TaxID=1576542 RepID=A0A9P9AFP6_9HYPO|nr:fungal-specific transcription factor domain-containing protein [Thelonectria olida]